MKRLGTALLLAVLAATPALACGFGEAPSSCGGSDEEGARTMLKRVVAAISTDEPKALEAFGKGQAGFRTVDTYVFCVGPTGVMTAHPNPVLQGQDVRDLHDTNGTHFIATMMDTAKAGEVSEIHYLFPRPGSTRALPKTTYYTRAGDQVCGVGVYDGSEDAAGPAASPQVRLVELEHRIDAAMPDSLRSDWRAFLEAMEARDGAQAAAFAKAGEDIRAAEAALGAGPSLAEAEH